MPATFGAAETYGLTAPSGGYVEESTREQSVELATVRNNVGVTVKVAAVPMVTANISIKGKGDPELANVTAGAIAADTVKIVRAKGSEKNKEFPGFEIEAVKYTNL